MEEGKHHESSHQRSQRQPRHLRQNANGSAQTQVTKNTAADIEPAWAPDGSRIAFATNRHGNFEVYVMAANGSAPTRLTNHSATDIQPAWSSDGSRILFSTSRHGSSTTSCTR